MAPVLAAGSTESEKKIENNVHWPTFLAGNRDSVELSTSPIHWSPDKNILWRANLTGYGQSSPIVWGNNVYVSSVIGDMKDACLVQCIGLQSGTQKWQYTCNTKNLIKNDDYHSRASITGVADATGFIAGFECGKVIAFNHEGVVRWERDLFEEFGPIDTNHGISSSLAQTESLVHFWVPRKESPYLVTLDKSTGDVRWKNDLNCGTSWSSPIIAAMEDGSSHLVLSCTGVASEPGFLLGLNPNSGEELWRLSGLKGNTSQTPVIVSPGRLLIGASTGRDGGPTKESIATNGLVHVTKTESGYSAEYVWRSNKGSCGFCSPSHHLGIAYFADKRGILTSYDIATGDELYSERLGQGAWATPIGIGEHVYFLGEQGQTYVVHSGREFRIDGTNELFKKSDAEEESIGTEESNAEVKRRQYALVSLPDVLLIRSGDEVVAISKR